jgi:hypothetical protein
MTRTDERTRARTRAQWQSLQWSRSPIQIAVIRRAIALAHERPQRRRVRGSPSACGHVLLHSGVRAAAPRRSLTCAGAGARAQRTSHRTAEESTERAEVRETGAEESASRAVALEEERTDAVPARDLPRLVRSGVTGEAPQRRNERRRPIGLSDVRLTSEPALSSVSTNVSGFDALSGPPRSAQRIGIAVRRTRRRSASASASASVAAVVVVVFAVFLFEFALIEAHAHTSAAVLAVAAAGGAAVVCASHESARAHKRTSSQEVSFTTGARARIRGRVRSSE